MRSKIILTFGIVLFLGLSQIESAELIQRIDIRKDELKFTVSERYDKIYLKGCELTGEVGKPQLPLKLVQVALPAGSKVEGIIVTTTKGDLLTGEYNLFPVQPPRILSRREEPVSFIQPELEIYQQETEYPGKLAEYISTGYLGGYQLANVLLYPLQYLPAQKKVKFYSSIEFKIIYSAGEEKPLFLKRKSESAKKVYEDILKRISLDNYSSEVDLESKVGNYGSSLPAGDYEYVIVTHKSFVTTFQPLADWKTRKGIPAKIVDTEWIYSLYSGYDSAEKIRNFIKDAYLNWGTVWVLLGGDVNRIPARAAWAMDCEAGMSEDENDIRCDLYFSDLDGTWDANGNHLYGEVDDSVDMYPDVFTGRASCSDTSKARALVNKILTYEKNPPTDYETKMLFLGEVLWSSPLTDGGVAKDLIDEEFVPGQFDPITKLYETLGNENKSTVLTAINEGQNIINHNGHCWYTVMGVGGDYLGLSDMDGLYNSPSNSILFSIGCWPAAIDYDCVAEHFTNNPDGGGVAFIGNSRYGWGSPGNSEYGYSDRFDQQFFAAIFSRDIYKVGAAVADMKSYFVPLSQQENVYRWCMYETLLLGDPEMSVWTDVPQPLWVWHPQSVNTGDGEFTVTVCSDSGGTIPLADALICIIKGEEVYQRGLTDSQGQVRFGISPTTSGEMYVTATAHNFLYYTDTVTVSPSGVYLSCGQPSLEDIIGGNGDGQPNPGETIQMILGLKNYSSETAYGVSGILHSKGDPYLNLIDSVQSFGDIAPEETGYDFLPFSFSIAPSCPNNHVAYFELEFSDTSEVSHVEMIPLAVVTPNLVYYSYLVDDTAMGNGDGIPDPGESLSLFVYVKNQGQNSASNVSGYLSTSCSYITIQDSIAIFGDIGYYEAKRKSYEISISSDCPSAYFPSLYLRTESNGGYVYEDSFIFSVGGSGFVDDMEAGDLLWTHSGTGDLWHPTDHRKYSGNSSWYNGIEDSWYFNNNMASWLKSFSFVLGQNSSLSFWLWYDVTNYGVDGIYVEIVDEQSGIYDTLDFIGSGGALDSLLNTGNDWMEYRYDLSHLPAGTNCYLRFSFISDAQYTYDGEGFYLDDVKVEKESFPWMYGDADCDMDLDIGDAIYLINYLFKGGPAPVPDLLTGDANCNGEVTVSDVVYLINYLFKGGPKPCIRS